MPFPQKISVSWEMLLFALALPLVGCQTETAVDEQAEPELPDGEIAIEDPWIRPVSAGGSTALYMTVANGQSTADTLIDARAPVVGGVHLREPASEDGDSRRTQPLDSIAIPAEMRTAFEPGGQHLVLENLSQSLTEDGSLLLDLVFSQSGRQRIQAPVRSEEEESMNNS